MLLTFWFWRLLCSGSWFWYDIRRVLEKGKGKKMNTWISQRQNILGNRFLVKYSVSDIQYYA